MSRKNLQGPTYEGLPLSETIKNDCGFNQDILEVIRRNQDRALERHSQVLFMLFTFSYPSLGHANPKDNIRLSVDLPQGNEVFCYFLNQYIRQLDQMGYDPRYLWCRERSERSDHCHYHLALWLNRNAIQYFGSMEQIDRYWAQALANFGIVAPGADTAGLIDRGIYKQNDTFQYYGLTIHRGNEEEYNAVFQRASYLGKNYSKDNALARIRTWGSSER